MAADSGTVSMAHGTKVQGYNKKVLIPVPNNLWIEFFKARRYGGDVIVIGGRCKNMQQKKQRPKEAKDLKGLLSLAAVVALMVAATQMTAAFSPESATVIMSDGSTHDAECVEGGVCIIPGESRNVEDPEVDDDWYEQTMTWYDGSSAWSGAGQVKVTTCGKSPNGVCYMFVNDMIQDSSQFTAKCQWDDGNGEWFGEITVNGATDDCDDPEFFITPIEHIPGLCNYQTQMSALGSNFYTGDLLGKCVQNP